MWSQHTHPLAPIRVGHKEFVQNQRVAGKAAKRWDRTGTVLEDKGFDKYSVKIDGSGRVTDRNRRYLRFFKPDSPILQGPSPGVQLHIEPAPVGEDGYADHVQPQFPQVATGDDGPALPQPHEDQTLTDDADPMISPARSSHPPTASRTATPAAAPATPTQPRPGARRSTRIRRPNIKYPVAEFDLSRD